jgi:hypothetical protein
VPDKFGRTATGGGAADAGGEEDTPGCRAGGDARRVQAPCGFRQAGAQVVAATLSLGAAGVDEPADPGPVGASAFLCMIGGQ